MSNDIGPALQARDTGRIQEAHITAGHILVELIEDVLKDRSLT